MSILLLSKQAVPALVNVRDYKSMDAKETALVRYTDNLNLYPLCANCAAILTIIVGSVLLLLHIVTLHGIAMQWVMLGAAVGTTILLIGRRYFPRFCSACLLAKFHFSNAYFAWKGLDISPWLTLISSTFFCMGCVESVQSIRIKKGLNSFWLALPRALPTMIIILIGTLLAMISSGYIYKLIF